jgi:putative hydrolases of HD superfamily
MRDTAKFLYEIGQLKRVRRSGWWLAGIKDPESVAEHSFRTAILGYIMACSEGANPMRTAAMCLFHDVPEARVSDLHRVSSRYLDVENAETLAFSEQMSRLPTAIAEEIISLILDYQERKTIEAQLAHDADSLECLLQAREYQAERYANVTDWIDGSQASLRTETAKNLAEECLQVEPNEWWQGLKVRRTGENK